MAARLAKLLSESSSVLARKRARGKACSARLHHEKDFSMHATWLGLGLGLALALGLGLGLGLGHLCGVKGVVLFVP